VSKFKIEDFEELAVGVKASLDNHDIPKDLQFSLISEILFNFSAFIDERVDSNLHEIIDSFLDEKSEVILANNRQDYLLADVEIIFNKGRKIETNILYSALSNRDYNILVLEVAFGIRDIDELDDVIDIEPRLKKLLKKKEGISIIKFQPLKDLGSKKWLSVPLKGSEYGDFEQNIEGVYELMCAVAKQWA
jgi:hypothetical protein